MTVKKGTTREDDDTSLAVEAPKLSCVPWVWFKAIVHWVAETIHSLLGIFPMVIIRPNV